MDILPVNSSLYNHSRLVNDPPFITNTPILEPIEKTKNDFKTNELMMFREAHDKEKRKNGIVWGVLLSSVAALGYCTRKACIKVQNYLHK